MITSVEGMETARSILERYWSLISHRSATFACVRPSSFLRRATRVPII